MAPLSFARLVALGFLVTSSVALSVQKTLLEEDDTPLPLVIWHGLGDDYAADGLGSIGELAEAVHPGTFVYFIRIDDNASQDRSATFLGNVTDHIAKVCDDLASHPILSTAPAIDALGFSQGGQFLRGYVERCNKPPVRSLVTFGSQHNGIVEFRDCPVTDWLCRGAMALLHGNAWSSFVQGRVIPAQYYRNPAEYAKYLESSNFLADINNERPRKNRQYKDNISKLTNLVLYMFEDDTTVIPKESAWFDDVNGTEVTPLRTRKLYTEDWLGLRRLDHEGGLKFRTTPGGHMQLSEKVLSQAFAEFFGPLQAASTSASLGQDL